MSRCGNADRHSSKCLHRLFEEQAAFAPDAAAVAYGDRVLSYGQVERAANRVARRLHEAGVSREDRVGLYLTRRAELLVGILGILKSGAAYVPVDPGFPEERVRFMLGDCGATTVVTEQSVRQRVPASVEVLDLDRVLEAPACADDDRHVDVASDPADLAYVIYTSGSTGTPKGTLIEHRHVARLLAATEGVFDFAPTDVWTLFHSPAFDFSVWEVWGALAYGGQVVVIPASARTPEEYFDTLQRHGVTVVNQTPQALRGLSRTILERGGDGLAVRVAITGGERLSPGVVRGWYQAWGGDPPRLVNMYGITETTVHVTYHTVSESDGDDAAPSVIGLPLPGMQVHVLDAVGRPVGMGVTGEMFVGGAGVGRGYLGRPELTRERFLADPFMGGQARMYRTGDLARFRSDGSLEYAGRSDDQVKIRGYRIELGEVESVLASLPAVENAAAAVHEDAEGGRRLVGYYVGAKINTQTAREELLKRLPEYMVPAPLLHLDALPLTPNGKIDRRALPVPGDERPELGTPYAAPRDETERLLADVWAGVLKVDRVGIHDNFFDLGGDSILAIAVVARASQLGMELTVGDLFAERTIAGLGARSKQSDPAGGMLPPFTQKEHRPTRVPVTATQAQACLISQLAEEALPYQFQAMLTFKGHLEDGLLVRSLQAIADRHDILRSHYVRRKRTWYQVVDPHVIVNVPIVDLGSATDTAAALGRLAEDFFGQRIDIDVPPLVRWKLVRLSEDHHVLLHVEHHLLHDGWSWNVFLGELVGHYRGRSAPEGHGVIPRHRVQFADFAAWQSQIAGSALGARQLAYWREQLADLPPPLALPSGRPRPSRQSFRGARVVVDVPEDLVERLRSVGSQHEVTLFMTMLSAFCVLLHRYSGQADVLVGSGIVNRRLPPFEDLIGMVLNTVALRGDLRGDPTVEELFGRIRRTAVDAYMNQDLPFEEVLEAVQPQRRSGAAPLYQVLFSFQDPPWADLDVPGVAIQVDDTVGNGSSKADVNVIVLNRRTPSNALTLMWEYATDLFDESEAQSMVDAYLCLARRRVSGHIDQDLASAVDDARDAGVRPGSRREGDPLRTRGLHRRGLRVQGGGDTRCSGSRVGRGHIAYGELNRKANRVARRLTALGATTASRVVVAIPRSPEAIVAVLAAAQGGERLRGARCEPAKRTSRGLDRRCRNPLSSARPRAAARGFRA